MKSIYETFKELYVYRGRWFNSDCFKFDTSLFDSKIILSKITCTS